MSENKKTSEAQEAIWAFNTALAKSAGDFWQTFMQDMLATSSAGSYKQKHEPGSMRPFTPGSLQEMLEALQKTWATTGSMDMQSLTQGMAKAQEMVLQSTQIWTEKTSKVFQELLQGIEQSMTAQNRTTDKTPLQVLLDSYAQSLHRMLNIPKLGLNRYYQERITQALDKLTIFSTVANEFSLLMLQPVESSWLKMQEEIQNMSRDGNYPQGIKDYYSMWIKILEGDYMNLLQSPEFVSSFHKVVHYYLEFYALYEEVMQDALQFVPVAKKNQIEEVYQENHLLKQEVKALSQKMQELEQELKELKGQESN